MFDLEEFFGDGQVRENIESEIIYLKGKWDVLNIISYSVNGDENDKNNFSDWEEINRNIHQLIKILGMTKNKKVIDISKGFGYETSRKTQSDIK